MAGRDLQEQYEREAGTQAGLQPDPLLHVGRSSKIWIWTVLAAVVAAVIVTFIAIGGGDRYAAQKQHTQGPPVTTGSGSAPPHTALPAGRTSAHEPLSGNSSKVR